MINAKQSIALFLALASPSAAFASDYTTLKTSTGVEYGFHQGEKTSPILIVITTDIKESMADAYSPIGRILSSNGYSVAAIDVPCHGKDQKKKEKYGLECWRARADKTDKNVFDGYVENLRAVISDIAGKHAADTKEITVLGVSRGGYLAMKVAAEIPDISTVVALAPVTDVFRLREFDESSASKPLYSLESYYPELSRKHLFIQINNDDDRVGTAQAMSFISGVTAAGGHGPVDLTAVVTPKKGHSTSEHEMAAAWVLSQRNSAAVDGSQMSAPK